MAYSEKSKKRVFFTTMGILAVLLLVGIGLRTKFFHSATDVNAKVYPLALSLGDTLFYADKTSFSAFKEWSFGDGNISINDSGYYVYRKAGFYQVILLINNKAAKSFSIEVKDKPLSNPLDSVTTIDAPTTAMQYQNIIFRANSKSAKFFSWKFGETGTVDSRDQMVIYAYQRPGVYTVTLNTDETQYPITQEITITPAFNSQPDTALIVDKYKIMEDDIKKHLQQIANGIDFNDNYHYLLNQYLCNNTNAVVKVNNNKENMFYNYCMGLQFDKRTTIDDVKVTYDEQLNCVTKIAVNQSN